MASKHLSQINFRECSEWQFGGGDDGNERVYLKYSKFYRQNILVKNEFGDWENEEAMTESIVQFVPQAEDNGQLLVCEARNSLLKPATGYLESDLRINIACK